MRDQTYRLIIALPKFIILFALVLIFTEYFLPQRNYYNCLPPSSSSSSTYFLPSSSDVRTNNLSNTTCEDTNMGKQWFNEHFQSNWVPLCSRPDEQDYDGRNKDEIHAPWSAMKCSMFHNTFRVCALRNVYFEMQSSSSFAFKLRCYPDNNPYAEHIFRSKTCRKMDAEWKRMMNHKPNKHNFDFQPMSKVELSDRSYLESFLNHIDNSTYYYDWVGGNWCTKYRATSSTADYYGNIWHALSFLMEIFSIKFANDAVHERSTYIFGSKIKNIRVLQSQFIKEADAEIPALMKPLFSNFIFMQKEKKSSFSESLFMQKETKPKRVFVPQLFIYPDPRFSIIWDVKYQRNYLKCPENQRTSPIISAFRTLYEEKSHMAQILRNVTESVEDIANSNQFETYYNHTRIVHNDRNIVGDILVNKYNKYDNVDIIYVSNRWMSGVNGSYCERRCIKNIREWTSKIVQRFDGLIIFGNPTYLKFSAQMLLFRSINMHFGMHGAGLAWTLFMKPSAAAASGNKTYFVFEVSPRHKKHRTGSAMAAMVGVCYAKIDILGDEGINTINTTLAMEAIENGLRKCR